MAKNGYYVYRDGKADFPAGLLREALRDFRARHQCAPAGIVVCRGMAEKVRAALAGIEPGLDVQENGGALWGEIWLPIPEEPDAIADPDAGGDILDKAHPGQKWMQPGLSTMESMPGSYQEL